MNELAKQIDDLATLISNYEKLETKYNFLLELITDSQLEEFQVFCEKNNL